MDYITETKIYIKPEKQSALRIPTLLARRLKKEGWASGQAFIRFDQKEKKLIIKINAEGEICYFVNGRGHPSRMEAANVYIP